MSIYGEEFDQLAAEWRTLENAHDREHPDRGDCGGVGGCTAMLLAVDLQHRMMDALWEWRTREPAGRRR